MTTKLNFGKRCHCGSSLRELKPVDCVVSVSGEADPYVIDCGSMVPLLFPFFSTYLDRIGKNTLHAPLALELFSRKSDGEE